MPKLRPITTAPGLPLCVVPVGNGGVCKRPAIARISGRFPTRHVCSDHLDKALLFYEREPVAKREGIEYLTARARQP